jgi:hypothetical protein
MPMSYQGYTLNLCFDTDSEDLIAWGLYKTEYYGLELMWFKVSRLMGYVGLRSEEN